MFVSRHVNFVESVFPYHTLQQSLPRSDPNTCDLWLSLPSPTVTATVHEMASQTSLLNSRARAASPSPSQLPPATVTFSAADTVTAACREPPVSPAVSRASPTAPDSAPNASHVTPDSPVAASEPGLATSPPAATATHHMVTRSKNNIHKPLTKLSLTSVLSPTQTEPSCVS